ncbi:hypothetical protein TIFTF001_004179 [Ficus carica]|uniref:Uncharacterized protein n=1 Tax=Ficus carica TaxID=3494 RepID=A0AA87ZWU6_FICCA|nr:hypothetical protein TIFTF001_004179 [Ficus carica]
MSGSPSTGSSVSHHDPHLEPRHCRPYRDDGILAAPSSRRNHVASSDLASSEALSAGRRHRKPPGLAGVLVG